MIDVTKLIRAMPQASEPWLIAMIETMPKWGIVGIKREAAFLGQMRVECLNFTKFTESLYYRDPERIARIFRTAFDLNKDKAIDQEEIRFATNYIRNPEKLANRAYANRFGNGDEASGDGFRYRGRGPTQTTFKDNYRAASEWTGTDLVKVPDEMLVPRVGCAASCGYWKSHGCNEMADGDRHKDVTRQINPGLEALEERLRLVEETRLILS
jgi:putative chitinase